MNLAGSPRAGTLLPPFLKGVDPKGAFVRGIINIVLGVVFIIGGLTGQLALIGTQSGGALAVVGGILVALGLYRVVNQNN